MALAPHEQFLEAIKRSHSVAVVLPSAWTIDSLGSALALGRFVESCGKPAEMICADFINVPHLAFLPGVERIKSDMHAARHTVVTLPLSGDLHNLQHEVADGMLKIMITPKSGAIDHAAIASAAGTWRHDLIIAVSTRELKELGTLMRDYGRFFEETPIVNIDAHPENERYGSVNIIDMRASATAELVHALIESIDSKLINNDMATCLLAGIVSETKSFRSTSVTPRTLEAASRLVTSGARREIIVEALFRTRPVETLRLWGRVLARLKADREHKIVWSVLGRADFIHAGADETHLPDVIDELISRAPDADIICLLHEHPQTEGKICGLISAERGWNAMDLAAKWQPTGSSKRAAINTNNVSLPVLEQDLISGIRSTVAALRNR